MNARHPIHPATAAALTASILVAVLSIAGCNPRTSDSAADGGSPRDPTVYADRLTGCQYLATGVSRALTPRMNATGHQICVVRP